MDFEFTSVLPFAVIVKRFFLEFLVNTASLPFFSSIETTILLHILRHLSYDIQMPRRNRFWIIDFALMVPSFNPRYSDNSVSHFLRCLRFTNEGSFVCTILDCFLYENIISWETCKAAWLTLVGVGSAPINKQWTHTEKRKWDGFLLTIDWGISLKRVRNFRHLLTNW